MREDDNLEDSVFSLALLGKFESHNRRREPAIQRLLLTRDEIQLHFSGGRVIGGHILPLPDRQCGRIHENWIASNGRDFSHRAVWTNRNRQADDSTNRILFQFVGILGRDLVDQFAQGWSVLSFDGSG